MGYMHVGGRGVAAPPAGSGGAPGSAHYAFNGSPFPTNWESKHLLYTAVLF